MELELLMVKNMQWQVCQEKCKVFFNQKKYMIKYLKLEYSSAWPLE